MNKVDRYKKFCKAFGIKDGDKIKIPGWFTYEAREEGFYHNEIGYIRKYCYSTVFDIIIERGFEVVGND